MLATVHLAHPDKPVRLKAEAWVVRGHLFSLVFDKPPKRFFAGCALNTFRPEIADIAIWVDPMLAASKALEVPVDQETLSGWPRELFMRGQLRAPRAPVHGPERASLIARIDAQLPLDYLELTEQMDGARVGECQIHGLTSIRTIALAIDNYYILAEIGDHGGLAVKDGSKGGELYRLSYEGDDDDIQQLNRSFRGALAEFCCKSQADDPK
jgi:hypothetical protein